MKTSRKSEVLRLLNSSHPKVRLEGVRQAVHVINFIEVVWTLQWMVFNDGDKFVAQKAWEVLN